MNCQLHRREFLRRTAVGACSLAAGVGLSSAQDRGVRPLRDPSVEVLNPRGRVPVGLIIDDSTCLVNLNRFAMPQFDEAHAGRSEWYRRPWRDWPLEIPDAFVRKFGEWSAQHGVKGKYSIVPYPACVGRLDRLLPGWSARELQASLELVRTVIAPNWDIHPEMVTHTRVIDTRTGHPYPEVSLRYMENWDWTHGRSVDELADYLSYALEILKNVGLHCDGITTPGGFGNRVLPELAQASLQSLRHVYHAEIPHYFRHLYDEGTQSVAPRVEYASGLDSDDPRCVVSIIGCTGDWTGGWDCTTPEGADRFISPDLQSGRMVDVITRGDPAMMVCHWTGIYWNGQELGFRILQEVVKRLHARFDHLIWMKLAELSRYWAARELTTIRNSDRGVELNAAFACPQFTVRINRDAPMPPRFLWDDQQQELKEVDRLTKLTPNTYWRGSQAVTCCFDLPKGFSRLALA